MAPALELGTTPAHGYYSLQAVMLFPRSVLQNTVDSANLLFFCLSTCSSRFFSRGALFCLLLYVFLLTGTWSKSCLGATSVLNEFFRNGVKISLITGYRYITLQASGWSSPASTARPRPGTGLLPFPCCEYILKQGRFLVCQLLEK